MSAKLFNLDAEMAVLGAILNDNKSLGLMPDLTAAHFHDPVNARIFADLRTTVQSGRLADPVSVRNRYLESDMLKDVGGAGYLLELVRAGPGLAAQTRDYASLLSDLSMRRDALATLKAACARLETDHSAPADEILADTEQEIAAAANEGSTREDWSDLSVVSLAAVRAARSGRSRGISTGFEELDEMTGGGRPGRLWTWAGATSMGKSVGGAQIARNVAALGFGVGEIHLEMDEDEIGLRTAAALAFVRNQGMNPHYLSAANGALDDRQWAQMEAAAQASTRLPIYLDARAGRTVGQIEAAARRLFQRMRRDGVTPGLLLIDHQGLIAGDGRYPSELEKATDRAAKLKDMAKRLGVWTIALAQITKDGSSKDGDDHLPAATDIKYGGALIEASHVVILMHRKAYYAERKPKHLRTPADIEAIKQRDTLLIVDKARGGRRGQITVYTDLASAAMFDPRARA